ncbi:MAG: ATP-binding protein [Bryobacteraceae bacterium]
MSSEPPSYKSFEWFPQESAEELYEHAPCGYLSTTPDGLIARTNATFAGWLDYGQNELTSGMRLLDLLTPGGKIFYETHFAPLMRMYGEVNEIALDFNCKDGRTIPSLVSATQKRDSAGTPILNRVTVFNTTERRRYEHELLLATRRAEEISAELAQSNAALLKANEELDEFAYAASHDLQEPLRTMSTYAQLLARRYQAQLDANGLLFLDNIVESSSRMQALISDLLSLSQTQGSHLVLRPTNMKQPLQLAISNLRSALDETKATVTHDDLPVLTVDAARMTQLFQNLVGNGIKYRKPDEPPRIHVSCMPNQHACVISVQDNGIGFESDYAEQIFGMFKRLHGRETPGTGIGLAICKKIVESHGGRIWAESTPGVGSTFSFSIPVSSPE